MLNNSVNMLKTWEKKPSQFETWLYIYESEVISYSHAHLIRKFIFLRWQSSVFELELHKIDGKYQNFICAQQFKQIKFTFHES